MWYQELSYNSEKMQVANHRIPDLEEHTGRACKKHGSTPNGGRSEWMDRYDVQSPSMLLLGKQGENRARQIRFDISSWMDNFGPGTVQLLHQRRGDEAPYPVAVEQAGKDYSPSGIANYCYELTKEFNQFYHDYSILGADTQEEKTVRLVLARNVGKTIKNGMALLGIEVPERM